MPPSYKPLPVQQSPWIPEEVYNTPAKSLEDIEREFAQLRAQELANEASDLRLSEAQREVRQKRALQDEIQQRFGGTANDANNFNPDEALKIAQRLALQSGDLDTALSVERAQRERRGFSPYGEAERAVLSREFGYELPPNSDPTLVTALTNIRGKNLYSQSLEDTREKREQQMRSRLPEGWGGDPTEDDAKKFKTLLVGTGEVDRILNDLSASLARTGTEAATGSDYVLQRQLVGDLALVLKSPAFGNLGAALSPSEYELLLTQLPILIASPQTSLGRVLVERGLGRDPLDAIKAIKNKIQRKIEVEAPIRRMYRLGGASPSAAAPLGPIGAQGKLPRNPDGTKLSREQFYSLTGRGQ